MDVSKRNTTANMPFQSLLKTVAILLIIVLGTVILVFGKSFFIPLTFAALLAMVLLPVCTWLEKKGVNKAIATVLSIMVLVSIVAGIMAFIGWQISDLAKDTAELEKQITEKYQEARQYISDELGVSRDKQKELIQKQKESGGGGANVLTSVVSGLGGLLANGILVLVYIFLLLYFREHLRKFIIRIVPDGEEEKAAHAVSKMQHVSQKYLVGMAQMIGALWIMYGIGFSLVGVKHALFFAVLCGLLEIVPFVGNLVGNILTVLMALSQGGDINMVIGILVIYFVVQFVQSYILEPLIVGAEVNINPLFTIVGLIAGELIWGIPGMILAIPLLGIVKIIFDHIEPLKPFGELIGEDKKSPGKLKKKFAEWVRKIKRTKKNLSHS